MPQHVVSDQGPGSLPFANSLAIFSLGISKSHSLTNLKLKLDSSKYVASERVYSVLNGLTELERLQTVKTVKSGMDLIFFIWSFTAQSTQLRSCQAG